MSLVFKAINIGILLVIVFIFLRRAMTNYFKQQREDLERTMKRAAAELEKIESEYAKVHERMQNLDLQLEEMRKLAEQSIQKESERVRRESEEYVEKLSRDAHLRMDQEVEKTKRLFQRELVDAAMASARAELSAKLLKQDEAWTSKTVADCVAADKSNMERTYAS